MTWTGQERALSRTQQTALARRVIARDRGICYVCGLPGANEADHVVPLFESGPEGDCEDNMAAIHARPCHLAKTQAEAARARALHRRARDPERHPGAL
jgi:5-methylcytosine-specific restriction enzyme A